MENLRMTLLGLPWWQWLRLHTSNAGSVVSVSGWGTPDLMCGMTENEKLKKGPFFLTPLQARPG